MSLIINDKKVAGLYKAYVIQNATNTASGIIRIATEEEVKAGLDSSTAVTPKQLATKQDVLIAGNGLEILEDGTINNTQTSAEWGNIIGNILDQEDLNAILLTKANEEETAYELVYEDSILTLKNRKGDILSTVSINELPDVDDVTIVINEENKLQSIGEKTKSGTFKYTWIGTEAEYTDAKDLGIIDEFTECIIIDSEAEKVVPIVQYEAPTKLSQLANDIEFVTNDELQSVKTSLENKIDLQTDGAEIVHRVGNETIDGFKNFKQKIVIENGLGKGRIAHKPTDTSLEDGYIEFGEDTLLYGKQNINGELYDEKHDIFHAGNLVAGNNITITENNGVYSINGKAGGGTGEPSTNVLVDDITIVKNDNDIITTVGVKSKNDTILYDWIGTENEYNIALENGTIQPNWICYITDDVSYTDDIRPEIDRLDNVKANKDLSNLSEVGEKHFLNKSQITNCLLEVPQRIKLELNNGTLTLKAGSEVIVPNGFEEDGVTPKFDYVTVESDKTLNYNGTVDDLVLCVLPNNGFIATSSTNVYSGADEPAVGSARTIWYDTQNNIVRTRTTGNWLEGLSLPIAVLSISSDSVTNIKNVFNGLGYFGSTVWVDKGVKGLIPNGRNEDGSLKNIEFITSKLALRTDSLVDDNFVVQINEAGFSVVGMGYYFEQETEPTGVTGWTVWFNTRENRCYLKEIGNSSSSWTPQDLCNNQCVFTVSNGVITSMKIKQPFKAVDYQDASRLSMPSSKYIDLELGASGTTYTAPANGYFGCEISVSSQLGFIWMYTDLMGCGQGARAGTNADGCRCYIPVKKGQIVKINYEYLKSKVYFRFIYAEGEI